LLNFECKNEELPPIRFRREFFNSLWVGWIYVVLCHIIKLRYDDIGLAKKEEEGSFP